MNLSEEYWDNRYRSNDIGWDLGEVSPPLKSYIDQLSNKNLKILIPGGGNAYEAEYLHNHGFKNVYLVDISKTALNNFQARVPSFPTEHLMHNDFFHLNMSFDVIMEQTFFCAINPNLRARYVEQSHNLLQPDGKMVGLLFDAPLNTDKPPFGGCKADYLELFKTHFDILLMEESHNSHHTRLGKELFFIVRKKTKEAKDYI